MVRTKKVRGGVLCAAQLAQKLLKIYWLFDFFTVAAKLSLLNSHCTTAMALTPPDLKKQAQQATETLLPVKSRKAYDKWFERFEKWQVEHQVQEHCSESVLLAFFQDLTKDQFKPTTLWTSYSCLKKELLIKKNKDISIFEKLKGYLKALSVTYQKKKVEVFIRKDVEQFLKEAPTEEHLREKLILLFGLFGGLRADELTHLTFEDITKIRQGLKINLPHSKTDKAGEGFDFIALSSVDKWKCPVQYYRLYFQSFPVPPTGRFFRLQRSGKFTNQPCGRSFFLATTKKIAMFLNKPDAAKYTGHAIRRTAATWIADAGGTNVELKKFGRWKSDTVAQGYVDRSEKSKRTLATMIQGGKETEESEDEPVEQQTPPPRRQRTEFGSFPVFNNCTFGGPITFNLTHKSTSCLK